LTNLAPRGTLRAVEVAAMEERVTRRGEAEPDATQHCYNCGERGEWQKCKLICRNPRCGVHIVLACVD
jgi:hypothetical protein